MELALHFISSAFIFMTQVLFYFHPLPPPWKKYKLIFIKLYLKMKQQAILCLFTDWTCASSSGVFPSRHQPSHAYLSRISTFTPIQAYSISSIRMYISICGRPASFETENKCCRQSQFSSVQFSFSVVSNSLRPHGLQHARPPCPSPTPRVYWN